MIAYLVLEDGSYYMGKTFGAKIESEGEIIFNTGMTGYQEILTDPAYYGQLAVMTYPLVGNYGTNDEDAESDKIHVRGLIVKDFCDTPSNFRCNSTLNDYLKKYNIAGLYGIDTRALTRKIREKGTMRGMISHTQPTVAMLKALGGANEFIDSDATQAVTTPKKYHIPAAAINAICHSERSEESRLSRLAVLDLGVRKHFLNFLSARGYDLTVFPASTSAVEILSGGFSGLVVTGGPGNPETCEREIATICAIIGSLPILAFSLGNSILACALGCQTLKLKYGHRGSNHPVRDLRTGKFLTTVQNHGYAVCSSPENCACGGMEIYRSLADGTADGVYYPKIHALGLNFYPDQGFTTSETAVLMQDISTVLSRKSITEVK